MWFNKYQSENTSKINFFHVFTIRMFIGWTEADKFRCYRLYLIYNLMFRVLLLQFRLDRLIKKIYSARNSVVLVEANEKKRRYFKI